MAPERLAGGLSFVSVRRFLLAFFDHATQAISRALLHLEEERIVRTLPPAPYCPRTGQENGRHYNYFPGNNYGPPGTFIVVDEPGQTYIDWSFNATGIHGVRQAV